MSDGTRYEKVTIGRIDAVGMSVRLPSGPKTIPFQKLPQDLQRRFQFDEDEATRLREQLDAAEKELARRVAEAKARAGEKDAADAADKKVADLVASKGYLSKLRARRVVVAQQIAEMRRKAEMQKSTFLSARARGSIASDESTRTMGKVRSLERSLGVLDASIAAEERKK